MGVPPLCPQIKTQRMELGMVAFAWNPSTWEAGAGRFVQAQPKLQNKNQEEGREEGKKRGYEE